MQDAISEQRPALLDLLTLEEIDRDLYRASTLFADPYGLYGGQVAAQALRAATLTVEGEQQAHSLHGYFLRRGNPLRPVVFQVHRDRDGRSYAARRVIALQDGEVIFNMAASFHRCEDGPDVQAASMPTGPAPAQLRDFGLDTRTVGIDFRDARADDLARPSRFWARSLEPVGDDQHLHACVLTYVSDMFSGLFDMAELDESTALTSLDHAIWFYRPVNLNDWVLTDLVGESLSDGRGHYFGRMFSADGTLVAGLAQESLFRKVEGHRLPPVATRQQAP